jgi:hypothetical protein
MKDSRKRGEPFHATPAHNRVRDDAKKRAALRSAGIEVLAVTLTDVKAFDSRGAVATAQDEIGLATVHGELRLEGVLRLSDAHVDDVAAGAIALGYPSVKVVREGYEGLCNTCHAPKPKTASRFSWVWSTMTSLKPR